MLQLLIVIALGWLFTGCATDTGDPKKDRAGRVTNVVLTDIAKAVGKAAFAELSAGFGDPAHADAAAAGLWTEGLHQAGSELISSNTVRDIINAYSGDGHTSGSDLAATAATAQWAFQAAAPKTLAEQKSVIATIASAISSAAASERAP